MIFKKKAEFDRAIEKSKEEYRQPEARKVMEDNAEEIGWKDILALTIAGLQVVAPRVLLFILSYLLLAFLFMQFVA